MSVLVLGALIGGAIFGASILWRKREVKETDLQTAVRLTIALLPGAGIAVLARCGIPVYFAGRTESMVWALAIALVAILILELPPVARRFIGGLFFLVGMTTIGAWLTALPARPPAPGVEVGNALSSMVEEGDRVVVAGLWQLEVRHGLAKGLLDGSALTPAIVEVETIPRSQAEHPGWLDREAATSPELYDEARALSDQAATERSRIWFVWSPTLPLESTVFTAFAGWRRDRVAASPIIAVDLLSPPKPGG